MLNQYMLIGRIQTINKVDNDEVKVCIAVSRSYKDDSNNYPVDYITVQLTNDVAKHTIEYCNVGDLIGIKGSIRCESEHSTPMLFAEKVTLLSSKGGE